PPALKQAMHASTSAAFSVHALNSSQQLSVRQVSVAESLNVTPLSQTPGATSKQSEAFAHVMKSSQSAPPSALRQSMQDWGSAASSVQKLSSSQHAPPRH